MTIRQSKQEPLTAAENKWLKAFIRAKKKAGVHPDINEIAAEGDATKQATHRWLRKLEAKGRLKRVARYRGWRLVEVGRKQAA